MKTENLNTGDHKKQVHSYAKHMKMMAICCGLPILGFLTIGILGISMPSLETLFLLICPIGMIGMMYMMHRDNQGKEGGHSCCQSKQSDDESAADITYDGTENVQQGPAKLKQSGTLEA